MADRAQFLESIRDRTARYRSTRSPTSVWTDTGHPRSARPIEDPAGRFLEELAALGGHGSRVAGLAAARDYLLALARERGARLLVRWDDDELERLAVDAPLREAGVEVAVWDGLGEPRALTARADIGLTTAAWAVAETGSIALPSGPGRGRSVGLLPPTHVAVVSASSIFPTLADAIARLDEGGAMPSSLALHTGPSRSGDIEMTLTVGVHGPGEVHVLLV